MFTDRVIDCIVQELLINSLNGRESHPTHFQLVCVVTEKVFWSYFVFVVLVIYFLYD